MELAQLKGVGKARQQALAQAGIHTLADLLGFLPVSYRDTSNAIPISEAMPGQVTCLEGVISQACKTQYIHGLSIVRTLLADDSGQIPLVWFNQPWMAKQMIRDERYMLYGRVDLYRGARIMQNPQKVTNPGLEAVYAPVAGVPNRILGTLIAQALAYVETLCPETLPSAFLAQHHLCPRAWAVGQAHQPEDMQSLALAKRRLSFEQLVLFQLAVRQSNIRTQTGIGLPLQRDQAEDFWRIFPYAPTGAQAAALDTIYQDLASGRPMRRLLQGDVGSGKTAVALGSIFALARCGWQSALMAPTELLARQHLQTAQNILAPHGIRCGLITGGMRAQQRREALDAVARGGWDLVIGTHALISQGMRYARLGLAITDEQHRFGVRQRTRLNQKNDSELPAHVLVMSATPIPRTLALILYGDLDVTLLNEMPPGRKPVKTHIVPDQKRRDMLAFVRGRVGQGEQAYYVCPLVEESEQLDAPSAQQMYQQLSAGELKGLRLGLTWGGQPSEEKASVLQQFSQGQIDVLVATTVIEVGVDVPRASMMIIERADRFGLSQLHQLRGRVGRGSAESWCFLLGEENERLKTLCQTNDGFVIAQRDLELRGPGEFLGTRQHGNLMPSAFAMADMALIEESRACVDYLLSPAADGGLRAALLQAARRQYAAFLEGAAIH